MSSGTRGVLKKEGQTFDLFFLVLWVPFVCVESFFSMEFSHKRELGTANGKHWLAPDPSQCLVCDMSGSLGRQAPLRDGGVWRGRQEGLEGARLAAQPALKEGQESAVGVAASSGRVLITA